MTGLLGLILSIGGLAFSIYDHWPTSLDGFKDKEFWLGVLGWLAAFAYCLYSCYLKHNLEKLQQKKRYLEAKQQTTNQELQRSNGTIDYLHRCLNKELKDRPIPRTQRTEKD